MRTILALCTAVAALILPLSLVSSAQAAEAKLYEMRIYYAPEGKLNDLHARFRDHTMRIFAKHGIENIGYWVPVDNKENKLVYLLAYPSHEARETSWKEFFADADWKAAAKASEANGKIVAKVETMFLNPTDYSPAIKVEKQDPARSFELRTYTTPEKGLDNLNKRFRDHTVALFEKHGIHNFGYWTPEKKPNTLVYLVTHKSPESAKESFGAFGKDPTWNEAKKKSEEAAGGSLTVKDGVKSEFLVPTDYSPTK